MQSQTTDLSSHNQASTETIIASPFQRCHLCGELLHMSNLPHQCPSKMQAQRGWECPRCNRIHAPYVAQCYCRPGEQAGDVVRK